MWFTFIHCLATDVFYMDPLETMYKQSSRKSGIRSCVEAGSNTSTVDLRVVGGEEKGTQCLRV
jgi:hypothetical protein